MECDYPYYEKVKNKDNNDITGFLLLIVRNLNDKLINSSENIDFLLLWLSMWHVWHANIKSNYKLFFILTNSYIFFK